MRMRSDLTTSTAFNWNWSAILAGVFFGLAVETLLVLFGAALGSSVGNGTLGTGFGVWSTIMTMLGLAIGGAVAAIAARCSRPIDGTFVGLAVWSVVVVASALLAGAFGPQAVGSALWSKFFGALLGLGGAIGGGLIGTRFVRPGIRPTTTRVITDETQPHA